MSYIKVNQELLDAGHELAASLISNAISGKGPGELDHQAAVNLLVLQVAACSVLANLVLNAEEKNQVDVNQLLGQFAHNMHEEYRMMRAELDEEKAGKKSKPKLKIVEDSKIH